MPLIQIKDEKFVKAENCYLIYEAITEPETVSATNKKKWHLRLAIHPTNPDFNLLKQFETDALANSVFKGVLPSNGTMPLQPLGPTDAGGLFNGWFQFYAGTYKRMPDIYVENQKTDVMQAGGFLYAGQIVDVLVHAYVNEEGRRGVAFGLNGFNIQTSKNAERLAIGGGGVDTSSAFGGGGQQVQNAQAAAGPSPSPQAAVTPGPGAAPANPSTPAQAHNFLPTQPQEVKRQAPDGVWTETQLRAANWTEQQIAALPVVQ